MLRVVDQIVNLRQVSASGNGGRQDMIVFITPKVSRSFTLFISVLSIFKMQRVEHELVQGFPNNSLPCKQLTTFSSLLLVSAQLVNVPLFLQNEFAAK